MLKLRYKFAAKKDTRPLYIQVLRMLPYGVGPAVNAATLPKGTSTGKYVALDTTLGGLFGATGYASVKAAKNFLAKQPLQSGITKKLVVRGAVEGAAFGALGSLLGSFLRERNKKKGGEQ